MTPDQMLPGTEDTIGSLRQTLSAIPLPVEKNHRDRLVAFMETDLLSLNDLAQEILRVPVAALHVCKAAADMARNKDLDILTLEQACGLLGTQRIGNLLKTLPTVEQTELPVAYRQIISISEHALIQARGLFSNRMSRLWHEMSLGCLLFLAPCWALIYHRPQLFEQWDSRHLAKDTVEGGDFGSDALLTLAQLLAQDWWLPPWILQGYRSLNSSRRVMVKALHIARDAAHPQEQQAALDDDLRLSRWLTQPANSLLLANGIALGAHHDWQARHTHRWQQLTALYLGCAVSDVQQASHVNAVDSVAYLSDGRREDLWLPAESLIWPQGTRRQIETAPVIRPPRTEPQPEAPPAPAPPNPAMWREHCQALLSQPSPFVSLPALLSKALLALTQGLAVRQSWVALYNARERQLVIGASAGFGAGITGARLGPFRDTAWGSWLLGARCHPVHQGLLSEESDVPQQVRALLSTHGSFLLPIAPNGQLIGLLYASFSADGALPKKQRTPALIKTNDCLIKALTLYRTTA